jgi:hypothetical protein
MKYNGLHKKPTYDSLIDYIQNKQPILKYPNRLATEIMNSREMSKLNGIGISLDQQGNLMKEQQRINSIREVSINNGTTFSHALAAEHYIGGDSDSDTSSGTPIINRFKSTYQDSSSDLTDIIDYEVDADMQNQESRIQKVKRNLNDHLNYLLGKGQAPIIQKIMSSSGSNKSSASLGTSSSGSIQSSTSVKAILDYPNINSGSASSSTNPMPFGINQVALPSGEGKPKKVDGRGRPKTVDRINSSQDKQFWINKSRSTEELQFNLMARGISLPTGTKLKGKSKGDGEAKTQKQMMVNMIINMIDNNQWVAKL